MRATPPNYPTRILALDLHPRSFGYVVMEGAERLLDWGVKRSDMPTPKKHRKVLVQKRFRSLLTLWRPDIVLGRFGDRKKNAIQQILESLRKESGKVSFFPVKASRAGTGGATKHERASQIAQRFPEIGWKLPPKRRAWESEFYSMSIFEAAAAALVYFQPLSRTTPSDATPMSNQH